MSKRKEIYVEPHAGVVELRLRRQVLNDASAGTDQYHNQDVTDEWFGN